MTVQQPIVSTSRSPREFVPALFALFEGIIRQRRETYHASNQLIFTNLANGEPRRGTPKLRLKLDKLTQHYKAVEARRVAQRELMVVVPLYRRLLAGIQKKDSFDPAKSEILGFMRTHLAKSIASSPTLKDNCERELALSLQNTFPFLLAPVEESAAEPMAAALATPLEQPAKLKLYDKLSKSNMLDDAERDLLRTIFWHTSTSTAPK